MKKILFVCMLFFVTCVLQAQTTVTTVGGTSNYVSKFSGTSTIVNSSIFDNGTSVGIGTSSPTKTLSFSGNSARTIWMERHSLSNFTGNSLTIEAGGTRSGSTNKNGGDLFLKSGIATGTGSSNLIFYTSTADTVSGTGDRISTEKMRILGSGYVGIGTTTPTEKLEVNGKIKSQQLLISGGTPGLGKILTASDALGNATWQTSNAWQLTGNTGTDPATNFVGTIDSIPLIFRTKNTERMRIDENGNVGIGTDVTIAQLNVFTDSATLNARSALFTASPYSCHQKDVFIVPYLGNAGYDSLSVSGDQGIFWSDNNKTVSPSKSLGAWINATAGFVIAPYSNTNAGIRITSDGNVGIGTSLDTNNTPNRNPNNYKLAVNGSIGAKEVFVEITSTTWPDYVFDKKYNLLPLAEVESFINTNSHLPNVPSASEINDKGLALGEMNSVLLKKVEELTLYLIEQNKNIIEQNKIINNQQSTINEFKERMNTLESKIK